MVALETAVVVIAFALVVVFAGPLLLAAWLRWTRAVEHFGNEDPPTKPPVITN